MAVVPSGRHNKALPAYIRRQETIIPEKLEKACQEMIPANRTMTPIKRIQRQPPAIRASSCELETHPNGFVDVFHLWDNTLRAHAPSQHFVLAARSSMRFKYAPLQVLYPLLMSMRISSPRSTVG